VTITTEQLTEQMEQILGIVHANTLSIAAIQKQQEVSQTQIDNLRVCVIELRESQATVIQQFCQEQQAASREYRYGIEATLTRLERALDCMLADTANQGQLIHEIKDLSVRLVFGQHGGN
jgi:chromosome segregation ATPase